MKKDSIQSERIGVLMGGTSSEREISLKSGQAVFQALASAGCRALALDVQSADENGVMSLVRDNNIDVAFIALHGEFGEDGGIQNLLEKHGIIYTGSGETASRRAFDKVQAQSIFREDGIPVPEFAVVGKGDDIDEAASNLPFSSFVIKPAKEGSSIGIEIVHERKKIKAAVERAFEFGENVMIEEYIPGREVTVGILEGRALPIVEIRFQQTFFDFAAKYQKGKTEYLIPADIGEGLTRKIQKVAEDAYRILGCRHFARVDLIVSEEQKPFVLEINTIPGFTETSLLPKAAAAAGISFEDLCLKIVNSAYGETKQKKENPVGSS